MSHIRVNDVDLYYEITGISGEPIVLVHGSWGDHHNWDTVAPLLARSYRVLMYDRRGHSESTAPPGQGSVRDDVRDLAALLEFSGLAPAHVVGSSYGGAVVLRLAVARPDSFRTLTVHEPALVRLLASDSATAPIARAAFERLDDVVERLAAGDMEGGAHRFVERVAFGPGAWDTLPEQARRTFVRNAGTFLDEMRDPDDSNMDLTGLRSFPHPALLTQGDRSPPMFPLIVDRVAAAMPQARRETIPGAGHAPHATHPGAFADLIARFVSSAGR